MLKGALCALAACALWALTFVAPPLADASSNALTTVRYLVFGVSSVAVLWVLRFNPFARLSRRDWWRVVALGFTGNTLCFALMSAGVLAAGPTPVAFVFATLPIALVVVGNVRRPTLTWRSLAAPIVLIVAGLTVTAVATVTRGGDGEGSLPALGLSLAALALLSWLVYGTWNAEYLSDNRGTNLVIWASLTGVGTLVTLPLLAVADLAIDGPPDAGAGIPARLIVWGLILGLGASWLATWLWGVASSRVTASVLGMLIVAETLFAVAYACVIERRPPSGGEVAAGTLTLAGVLWGLQAARGSRRQSPGDSALVGHGGGGGI